jgi:hypothetical protein
MTVQTKEMNISDINRLATARWRRRRRMDEYSLRDEAERMVEGLPPARRYVVEVEVPELLEDGFCRYDCPIIGTCNRLIYVDEGPVDHGEQGWHTCSRFRPGPLCPRSPEYQENKNG